MSASSALIGLFYQSLIGVIELDFNYDVRFFAKLRDKSGVHLYLGIRILVLLREKLLQDTKFWLSDALSLRRFLAQGRSASRLLCLQHNL